MNKMKAFWLAILLALPSRAATVIDFDGLPNGTTLTNQYPGVVFSSDGTHTHHVWTWAAFQGTPPNYICSSGCDSETILDFSLGVSDLTFQGVGINNVSSSIAQVDVYVGGMFDSTVSLAGNAEVNAARLFDLSAFTNVTRIRIYNITDAAGIGWDTFSFTTPTPEPGTFLLAGLGVWLASWFSGWRSLRDRH